MIGWQIPAFGMWNYCNGLSITQYFDSAMQARLMKRWNRCGIAAGAAVVVGEKAGVACGEQQLVLFRTPSFQRKPVAQIKVYIYMLGKKSTSPPPFILGLLHPQTMKPSVLPPELSKTVYFTPGAVFDSGFATVS